MKCLGWDVKIMGGLAGIGNRLFSHGLAEVDFFLCHLLRLLVVGTGSSILECIDGG